MINYTSALYRRNNQGKVCVWYPRVIDNNTIELNHGIMNKTITVENVTTSRDSHAELKSRIAAKRKTGYKYLSEVKDNTPLPVEELDILIFLDTYLERDRSNSAGTMLHMLAKTYDNGVFEKTPKRIGQPKLNGLRCGIGAKINNADLFRPIRLTFQSREATYWDSLSDLEDYLLKELHPDLLNKMVNEDYILDGEIYLYGYPVTTINSFAKDPKAPENKLLQFWCYDIAIPDMLQEKRLELLDEYMSKNQIVLLFETDHTENTNRLVRVPDYTIMSHSNAIRFRDWCIKMKFEGGVYRDPKKEYQFGKRNSSMIKHKATTDGKFKVVDIIPEGDARPDIPLLLVRNDINNSIFKCHINGSFDYQKSILKRKEEYIGRTVVVEYGERSGVEQVPFHIKTVTFIED